MIWFAPFAGLGDDAVRPPFANDRGIRPHPPDRADDSPDSQADPGDEAPEPHQARASIS